MSTENLQSYGNGLIKDLRNTLNNVVNELKRQKLIEGQGVTLNHGPNGTTISVKKSAPVSWNAVSEETPSIPSSVIAPYLKNVCRLSPNYGQIPRVSADFTNSISGLTTVPYIYAGPYDLNVNGSIGTASSVFTAADSAVSGGTAALSSFNDTFTIGVSFTLTMSNPGGDAVNAVTNQIYFDWVPSTTIKQGDVSMTKSTSATFIPIAKYGLHKLSGEYSAELENVNQYPTLLTMIDQDLVNILDNIEFNEE